MTLFSSRLASRFFCGMLVLFGVDLREANAGVGASADLSITKTDGSATATPGLEVTYTMVAANAGPSAVVGAIVADAFPAPLIGCRWVCSVAGVGTCGASGNGDINDSVSLAAGASATYQATCTLPASATGTLSNTATIAAPAGVVDPTTANNSATDVDTLQARAVLAITKTDSAIIARPGGTVTYSIVASNAGPSDAAGVTVTDLFPAITTCTWTCRAGPRSSCAAAGTGNIVDATVYLSTFVEYTATCAISPTATGLLSNTATIAAPPDVIDVTPADNSATDTDQLVGGPPLNVPVPVLDGVALAALVLLLALAAMLRRRVASS